MGEMKRFWRWMAMVTEVVQVGTFRSWAFTTIFKKKSMEDSL